MSKSRWFYFILFLAILLRFFMLGKLPQSLTWDEAAIGYNAYGIITVHRDEWLKKLPVSFKSFGDYKAAVPVYLTAISVLVFGRNEFAVRFPMALAGIITVIASYFLAKKLFKTEFYALFVMLFTAISPLNVHFSRIAFESGIAVAIITTAIVLFLYAEEFSWFYLPSFLFFVVSMYAYHSTKITAPIILLLLLVLRKNQWRKNWKILFIATGVGLATLFPLLKEMFFYNAGDRFFMTSVLFQNNSLLPVQQLIPLLIKQFSLHLDPRFLLLGQSLTYRHGNNVFGIFGYLEFMLFVISFLSLKSMQKDRPLFLGILFLVFINMLPAFMSNDAPHSNRIHGVIPWIQILSVFGLKRILEMLDNKKKIVLMRILSGILVIQTLYFGYIYQNVFTSYSALSDFQYGYKEAVLFAQEHESGVNKIVMTSAYGQPYIYVLFYKGLTPIQWQQGILANYEFRDIHWNKEEKKEQELIIGTPKEIPSTAQNIVHEVVYPSGEIAFRIVEHK